MKNDGFSLLETLIAVQVLILVLTFTAFSYNEVISCQKRSAIRYQEIQKVQEKIELTKYLPWDQITSNPEDGIEVTQLYPKLKKIHVWLNNTVLETIIYKEGL